MSSGLWRDPGQGFGGILSLVITRDRVVVVRDLHVLVPGESEHEVRIGPHLDQSVDVAAEAAFKVSPDD